MVQCLCLNDLGVCVWMIQCLVCMIQRLCLYDSVSVSERFRCLSERFSALSEWFMCLCLSDSLSVSDGSVSVWMILCLVCMIQRLCLNDLVSVSEWFMCLCLNYSVSVSELFSVCVWWFSVCVWMIQCLCLNDFSVCVWIIQRLFMHNSVSVSA
jgi:hypothetical protein